MPAANSYFLLSVPLERVSHLSRLRLNSCLEWVVDDTISHIGSERVLVRGPRHDDELLKELRKVPSVDWFELDTDSQVIPWGKRVPIVRLGELAWRSLKTYWTVELEQAKWPGRLAGQVDILIQEAEQLEANTLQQKPSLLVCDWSEWHDFCVRVPECRLAGLAVAVHACGVAIVQGAELPPIEGKPFVENDGVAIPLGYEWLPRVRPKTLNRLLKLAAGEIALLHVGGIVSRISSGHFVRAGRAAVRIAEQGMKQ